MLTFLKSFGYLRAIIHWTSRCHRWSLPLCTYHHHDITILLYVMFESQKQGLEHAGSWNSHNASNFVSPVWSPKKSIPQSRGYVAGISMGWGYELSQVEVKNCELLFIFRGRARPQNVPEIWCKPFSFRRTRAFCRMPPPTELFLVLHQETSESFVVSAFSGRIIKNLIIIFWQEMRRRKKRLAFSWSTRTEKEHEKQHGLQTPLGNIRVAGLNHNNKRVQILFCFLFSSSPLVY